MTTPPAFTPANAAPWQGRPYHRQWLRAQADSLFDFFQAGAINPKGGFFDLDRAGRPVDPQNGLRQIHATARMVHCFTIGSLLGRPGSDEIVDHGLAYLWGTHRDETHGGYMWSLDDDGPRDDTKQAYGHAFVLLAASGGKILGHPLAYRLLADITEVLETRFWDEGHGAVREEFRRDWSEIGPYRGQNSNMHLTEALMAAFEATGERHYLDKAERIADLIINRHARALDFRVAEHFDENWVLDRDYRGADMFRPAGSTPGHWLEWSRLLLQLWVLGGRTVSWLPEAAESLFAQAVTIGWDHAHGGFYYTLDWESRPALTDKLWWPVNEGIGATAFLNAHRPSAVHEGWYRRLWDFSANHLLDTEHGGWHPELSETLAVAQRLFTGKPDIYHALQACLIPLFPAEGSLTRVIPEAKGAL
ncbi:AGE family epimerase/isomerase [Arsenicitalea aurantiaca]|uniref:AGE family epimerase/isomerase n=1 Tax=Arsenicitalea aurantiaca TaxID=1783274 RepID=A0A433X424_9HYPH|nr:AGE family epimerase/isomerase [Arsenicitalea aurantiaca]RUT28815.1 AGE family epimerase/isomerase [Arsenicitalea aurantiaca]